MPKTYFFAQNIEENIAFRLSCTGKKPNCNILLLNRFHTALHPIRHFGAHQIIIEKLAHANTQIAAVSFNHQIVFIAIVIEQPSWLLQTTQTHINSIPWCHGTAPSLSLCIINKGVCTLGKWNIGEFN